MKQTLLFIGLVVILTSCQLSPTLKIVPTATPPLNCSANEVIEELKKEIPYEEFTLTYNSIEGGRHLFFWIVDPSLALTQKDEALEINLESAIQHSIELSHKLKQANICTAYLFATINPIVVDKNYNKWFSGTIDVRDLPAHSQLTEKDIRWAKDAIMNLRGVWQRQTVIDLQQVSVNSCDWNEVQKHLSMYFSSSSLNAYYVFADNDHKTFTVQHQVTDKNEESVVFPNVGEAVSCFQPSIDTIMIILVDEKGNILSKKQIPMNP